MCYFNLLHRHSVCIYSALLSVSLAVLYQTQYALQFRGSLADHVGVLSTLSGPSFSTAVVNCANKHRGDGRFSGVEICKIRDDLYQCRACCSWRKLGMEQPGTDMDNCVYLQLVQQISGNDVNVLEHVSISMSSVYFLFGVHLVSGFAVDNITDCGFTFIAATRAQTNPWIKIDLGVSVYVLQVLIHARQDCCEPGRLHNVSITVTDNGHDQECGFYPGPTNKRDRILVLCDPTTRGRYVTLMILSRPGARDVLQVCEIQMYGHP